MTRDRNRIPFEPTPDQLAAYFDGALTGPARAAVETWLGDNPDASDRGTFPDHDDDLTRAWQMTQPAEPAPGAWAALLGRIGTAVPPPAVVPLRRRRAGVILGTAAAAAAAIGFILLGRALWPVKPKPIEPNNEIVRNDKPQPGTEPEEEEVPEGEPFAVLSSAQVRIISMDGDDTHVEIDGQMIKTLVVGEPPVADALLLLTSYDRTRLVGWVDPELHFDDWGAPMIIDPAVLAKGWQP